MAPGERSKFGAPMFEPEVFQKQMYRVETSTCDIVRTFWRPPQSFGALIVILRPENCAPLALPRYARGVDYHRPLFRQTCDTNSET